MLYTVNELAELFKVHRATVYRWVQFGDFPPPVKLGGNTSRWLRTDVERWITSRAETQTAESTDIGP